MSDLRRGFLMQSFISDVRRFRWVFCQLEILRRNLPVDIRSALNDMPKTLDETYRHALLAIDEVLRKYAQRLFQCLAVSRRPLRIEELAEILAVRFGEGALPEFNPDWRLGDAEQAVLSVCSNLISIVDVDGSQIVQFSHFSVKEYLTSDLLAKASEDLSGYYIIPHSAHAILAQASLSVLLQLDDHIDKASIKNFPLSHYAAQHWVDHGLFEDVVSTIQVAMEQLFDPDKPHFSAWVWLFDMDDPWRRETPTVPKRPQAAPLYYAILCGFRDLIEHLIATDPKDVGARGGYYETPLFVAFEKDDIDTALLLLQHGADVNTLDKRGVNHLHLAIQGGRLDVVRLLLEHKADINLPDIDGDTPLTRASIVGEVEISRLLLQWGADIHFRNELGISPLLGAARSGHRDLIQLLIDNGADVGSRDNSGRTSLYLASQNGHIKVAELLIQQGADVSAHEDGDSWTPLHLASQNGHVKVAELLIQHGADIGARDNDGSNPLHVAALHGRLDIVKLLLKSGADRNIRNHRDKTPSDMASDNGNLDVVNFLSRSETFPDGVPAMSSVSPQNQHPVVLPGKPEESETSKNQSSLCAASESGQIDVVRFLLEQGSDVNETDSLRQSALAVASINGNLQVAELLIEHGADVNSRDAGGLTPLHVASRNGHLDIVRLLLDHNANLDASTRNLKTALDVASHCGYIEIVKLLLRRGANANTRNAFGRTPAQEALVHRHTGVSELLAQHTARKA